MPPIKTNFDTDLAHFTPRQMEAIRLLDSGKSKFVLYGGALGGGKSYFLRWYGIRRLIDLAGQGFKNCTGMLACEDYPALKDRQLVKIPREFPEQLGTSHADHKEYGRCFILGDQYGGGVLCFRNLDDPSKYQSSEWVFILIDELTKNIYDTFTHLRTRLRWPGLPDIECQFVGGTNPGGPGHGWVKQLWMDKKFPPEWCSPVDYRPTFAYVPSKATDNPHLDAAYWQSLNTLPEGVRRAFRDGDWNTFIGQAFPELSETTHGIEGVPPESIPPNAPVYCTYDWGFGKPFSLGWWWVDADGREYRFSEWYGAHGPDEGLRLPDQDVAIGILDREIKMGFAKLSIPGDYMTAVWNRTIIRGTGFDCFNKRPDYKGGGQGPTTAEVMSTFGIHFTPIDSKRHIKIRAFRDHLRPDAGGVPKMLVYRSCESFFRTVGSLVMDKIDPEDVDSKGEDHCYDEACHICMMRTMAQPRPIIPKTGPQRIMEQVERRYDEDIVPWTPDTDEPGFFAGGAEW